MHGEDLDPTGRRDHFAAGESVVDAAGEIEVGQECVESGPVLGPEAGCHLLHLVELLAGIALPCPLA